MIIIIFFHSVLKQAITLVLLHGHISQQHLTRQSAGLLTRVMCYVITYTRSMDDPLGSFAPLLCSYLWLNDFGDCCDIGLMVF